MKRTPLRRQSDKRRSERTLRSQLKTIALRRDGGCVARDMTGPDGFPVCAGPLDADEIIARSQWPGGHLVLDNIQILCRAHHRWKHDHPLEAHELGLTRWSWER